MKRFSILPALLGWLVATPLQAADANPFFAMNTIARGGPEVAVPMLKELGFDGLGGHAGDEAMAKALESDGLRFFNGYLTIDFDTSRPGLDERLRGIIDRMAGHRAALWLDIANVRHDGTPFPNSSIEGDATAIAKLQEIASYAQTRDVRLALYPHAGHWLERVEDGIRIAEQLGHPNVGVTFNLCHWLKVEGSERDPLPVLRAALPKLMFITIHGADTGDTRTMGWDRLIQPLGRGSYDVAAFLGKVRTIGYTGPIGFQGFGIHTEPHEVLSQTIAAWRTMNTRLSPH